jgi:hypothetical protein
MSRNPNSSANISKSKIEQRNGENKWMAGKRISLQRKPPDFDEDGAYTVVDPRYLYRGKSYSEWITDWFNWFLSADADKRNSGPVVFLRSLGLPNRNTGAYTSDVPGQVTGSGTLPDSMGADIMNYSKTYVNDPNIRIGGDRLQIFDDQAVLVPIITAYWLKTEPQSDWGTMQDYTGSTIDHGDNPPDFSQLTINKNNIKLELDMKYFRITTPIFTALVPDTEYGRSVKDFLEHPISPGSYPAIVEGYFVMLVLEADRSYWIHSWASAPREISGPYFSELLYQIEVKKQRDMPGMITNWRPSRNERIFAQIFSQKEKNRDLTSSEIGRFRQYFISQENNKEIKRVSLVNNKEIKRSRRPPRPNKNSENSSSKQQ